MYDYVIPCHELCSIGLYTRWGHPSFMLEPSNALSRRLTDLIW